MKILSIILVITFILSFSAFLTSCSSEVHNEEDSYIEWDVIVTGCTKGWDEELKGNPNYKVGIIDFHIPVFSDSQESMLYHDELIEYLLKKIAPNCDLKKIILSENATSNEINYAIETLYKQGFCIINMSFGQGDPIAFSENILDKIENDTLVLVCAAGNYDKGILFPAADEKTISVYARDINGNIAKKDIDFATKQSFSAPGYHIYINGDYYSGSSLATVYLSVAFASIYAQNEARTMELIEMVKKKSINSVSYNDYGIIQIAPHY